MFKTLIPFRIPSFITLALSNLVATAFFSYRLGLDHERAKQLAQFQIEKAQLVKELQNRERQNKLANQQIENQRNMLQFTNHILQKKINDEIKTSPDYKRCTIPDNGLSLINAARHHASQIATGLPDATLSATTSGKR